MERAEITPRPICGRPARYDRTGWTLGIIPDEWFAATPCRRPEGHRGRCLSHPNVPPPPLRPIKTRVSSTEPVGAMAMLEDPPR